MSLLSIFLICLKLDLTLAFERSLILELLLLDKLGLAFQLLDLAKPAILSFFCLLAVALLQLGMG